MIRHRRPAAVLIAGLVILAVFGGYLTVARSTSTPNQVMTTIDPKLLADTNGIRLDQPTSDLRQLAVVSQEQAVETARGADPSYTVLESKLIVLRTPVVFADGCLCWGISLYPPNGQLDEIAPLGGLPGKRDNVYYLTFVDARTGALLFSAQGGRQIEPPRANPSALGTARPTPAGTPVPGR